MTCSVREIHSNIKTWVCRKQRGTNVPFTKQVCRSCRSCLPAAQQSSRPGVSTKRFSGCWRGTPTSETYPGICICTPIRTLCNTRPETDRPQRRRRQFQDQSEGASHPSLFNRQRNRITTWEEGTTCLTT